MAQAFQRLNDLVETVPVARRPPDTATPTRSSGHLATSEFRWFIGMAAALLSAMIAPNALFRWRGG
jgi:hypothetical protein